MHGSNLWSVLSWARCAALVLRNQPKSPMWIQRGGGQQQDEGGTTGQKRERRLENSAELRQSFLPWLNAMRCWTPYKWIPESKLKSQHEAKKRKTKKKKTCMCRRFLCTTQCFSGLCNEELPLHLSFPVKYQYISAAAVLGVVWLLTLQISFQATQK